MTSKRRHEQKIKDAEARAGFAAALREHGHRGHTFSAAAVDSILALSTNYDHMLGLVNESINVARDEK